MKAAVAVTLALSAVFSWGCARPSSSSALPGKNAGPAPAPQPAPQRSQPGPGQPLSPTAFNEKIAASQQKVMEASQRFAAVVDRYRKDMRRNGGDMIVAVREQVNQLKDARDSWKQLTRPSSPEGKAFYEAYLQLLDDQIQTWGDGQKLAQSLEDPAKAKEFDQVLHRLEEQWTADLAKLHEARQAFMAHAAP